MQKYKIHYVEAGQGETVILIPGSAGSQRMWNRLVPLLSGQYRLLALDYPPAEINEKDPVKTLTRLTDLIVETIRQLNIARPALIGSGAGGAIVFDLAARFPEIPAKIINILGYVSPTEVVRPAVTRPALDIATELQAIRAPIMYLYSRLTRERGVSLSNNLELLQKYQPRAWMVELEGSIFATARKNPAEIANLILDFLRSKPPF